MYIYVFISLIFSIVAYAFYSRTDKATYSACVKIYNKAKSKKPDRPEKDYLKIVLLTKPPFDYQFDRVIDGILEELLESENIESLSKYITENRKDKRLWENRERNLKMGSTKENLKKRNENLFKYFWGN